MSHNISGIITSFQYEGELPNVLLIGNYHFIPTERLCIKSTCEDVIPPYKEFSHRVKRIIRDLSFIGNCAYIETDFFVEGIQRSETWENGVCNFGPIVSLHGYKGKSFANLKAKYEKWLSEEDSINASLSKIGVYCHEDKVDEFDSVRLGHFRGNDEIIKEYKFSLTKK